MARLGKDFTDFDTDWNQPYDREAEDAKFEAFGEWLKTAQTIRFPIADGYAFYLVESMKPLVLRHVRHGDNWQVEPALIRGLRSADVTDMLRREAAMRKLFGG